MAESTPPEEPTTPPPASKRKKPADPDMASRSLVVDVFVDDEIKQSIINSIRHYRACCRKMYGIFLLSQSAGADIVVSEKEIKVKPDNKKSKQLMALATGLTGKRALYELRPYFKEELWPTALSFVGDAARDDVMIVWKSRDPEFTKAGRGWLALQGSRGIAQFNRRGIGFPWSETRPQFAHTERHSLTLKWDHQLGDVTFKLPRLDGGRYWVWRALRDGSNDIKPATLYLTEHDGQLKVVITYKKRIVAADVDPTRICEVRFNMDDQESFLRIVGPDGIASYDSLSAADAVGYYKKHTARTTELERRKASCGNPRRPWGHKKGWRKNVDVIKNATKQRIRFSLQTCHAWARRIQARAVAWRCGVVLLPKMPAKLFGHDFRWAQFAADLKYKCEEVKIKFIRPEGVQDEEETEAAVPS